jgi:hypothetical protein
VAPATASTTASASTPASASVSVSVMEQPDHAEHDEVVCARWAYIDSGCAIVIVELLLLNYV